MNLNDFGKFFNYALGIVRLDTTSIKHVVKHKDATSWAVVFVVLAGLASALFNDFGGVLDFVVGFLLWSFFSVGVVWVLAKVFGGKASYVEQYRAQGLVYAMYWVAALPFVGSVLTGIAQLWSLVVAVVVVRTVHKITSLKAFLAVFIPVLIAVVLFAVFITAAVSWLIANGGLPPEMIAELQSFMP
ncbi:MAG: YIP1 family protein [Candidatus Woesearchaeota archaeon]